MLPILHVVMKTLDKTCCHVYIYPKCLYDNITTLGYIMDKEQALDFIKDQISKIDEFSDDSVYQSGYVMGLINAFHQSALLSEAESDEMIDLATVQVRGF